MLQCEGTPATPRVAAGGFRRRRTHLQQQRTIVDNGVSYALAFAMPGEPGGEWRRLLASQRGGRVLYRRRYVAETIGAGVHRRDQVQFEDCRAETAHYGNPEFFTGTTPLKRRPPRAWRGSA